MNEGQSFEEMQEQRQARILDKIINYPNVTIKGKILDTKENIAELLKSMGITVKYNLMTQEREIYIPHMSLDKDVLQRSSFNEILNIALKNELPTRYLENHLDNIAFENIYHPITDLLKENKWDGIYRLHNLLQTIKSDNHIVTNKIIIAWMISAIAVLMGDEKYSAHGVLVIQGDQGIGKTQWIKKLCPLGGMSILEGATLDPSNKDSVMNALRSWIVELGEVDATFRKADISRLKSFLTSTYDTIRLPYAKRAERFKRKTVFAATVNDTFFLSDETGNRRWWVIKANEINYKHDIDMIQIWAEILHIYQSGHSPYIEREDLELINEQNKSFEKIDPLYEKLMDNYDFNMTNPTLREASATLILEEIGMNINRADATKIGNILTKMGLPSRKLHGVKLYKMPYKIQKINRQA